MSSEQWLGLIKDFLVRSINYYVGQFEDGKLEMIDIEFCEEECAVSVLIQVDDDTNELDLEELYFSTEDEDTMAALKELMFTEVDLLGDFLHAYPGGFTDSVIEQLSNDLRNEYGNVKIVCSIV